MTLREIVSGFIALPELERDECLAECWRRINATPEVQAEEFYRSPRAQAALANRFADLLGIRPTEAERLIDESQPTLRQQIVAEVLGEYASYESTPAAVPKVPTPAQPAVRIVGGPSR